MIKEPWLNWSQGGISLLVGITANSKKMVAAVEDQSSQPENISARVPQGSTLGPNIFSCFFNALLSFVRSEVRMFADEQCSAPFTKTQIMTHNQMQQDLDNMQIHLCYTSARQW